MRALRRLFSILLGLAAGAAAWKILADYGRDGHIEGEYIELPDPYDAPDEASGGNPAKEPNQPQ